MKRVCLLMLVIGSVKGLALQRNFPEISAYGVVNKYYTCTSLNLLESSAKQAALDEAEKACVQRYGPGYGVKQDTARYEIIESFVSGGCWIGQDAGAVAKISFACERDEGGAND